MSIQAISKIVWAVMMVMSVSGLAAQEISCIDAGGYYGNLKIVQVDRGLRTRVIAAQGFAFEISTQLGARLGRESSELSIDFETKQCVSQRQTLRCAGKVIVNPSQYSKNQEGFVANAEFTLVNQISASTAQLKIQPSGRTVIGQASHDFKKPGGECRSR